MKNWRLKNVCREAPKLKFGDGSYNIVVIKYKRIRGCYHSFMHVDDDQIRTVLMQNFGLKEDAYAYLLQPFAA